MIWILLDLGDNQKREGNILTKFWKFCNVTLTILIYVYRYELFESFIEK